MVDTAVRTSGYLAELEADRTVEAEGRIENLRELVGVAAEFESRDPEARLGDLGADEETIVRDGLGGAGDDGNDGDVEFADGVHDPAMMPAGPPQRKPPPLRQRSAWRSFQLVVGA